MPEKETEELATAISGAFLLPDKDLVRELGIRRQAVTREMELVCQEYGVSMYLLVKRAALNGILSAQAEKRFYVRVGYLGWQKHEPSRIKAKDPILFEQLVYRAINEKNISIQRGAELLRKPFAQVAQQCGF